MKNTECDQTRGVTDRIGGVIDRVHKVIDCIGRVINQVHKVIAISGPLSYSLNKFYFNYFPLTVGRQTILIIKNGNRYFSENQQF